MPKSKRSKLVSLTQVKPATKQEKSELIEKIEGCVNEYQYIYLFQVENMRNTYLKEVRDAWKGSKMFLGKNKIMQIALGLDSNSAKLPNIEKFSQKISGSCGLLFTNSTPEEVQKYFEEYKKADYPRPGVKVDTEVKLPAGVLHRGDDTFPHNMEPLLRSLGLNTRVERGVVTIPTDHVICKPGDTLTVEQAHLLKHFYHQLALFQLKIQSYFHNEQVFDV